MKSDCLKLLTFIILIVNASCKDVFTPSPKAKPVEELPAITQEGKETFGCLVNGEVWLPKYRPGAGFPGAGGGGILQSEYYPRFKQVDEKLWGAFFIKAKRTINGRTERITIYFGNLSKPGKYILNRGFLNYDRNNGECEFSMLSDSLVHYYSDTSQNNWLEITKLDTVNFIVSGLFEFNLIKDNNSLDTIKVRNGRFDMPFIF